MSKFQETQIIQCPSKKSFDSHFKAWSHIKKIGLGYNCEFEWDVLDKKDKTFILKVHGCSKQDQQNALIDVMKYLCKEGIEPAIVLSTKTKKSDAELKFDQVKRILKFA